MWQDKVKEIIDILENCDIHVTVENEKKYVSQEKLQDIINVKVSPIISKITNYLSQISLNNKNSIFLVTGIVIILSVNFS